MTGAITDADAVVLCYSAYGIDAPWMKREWLSALARHLNGEGIRLLPVRRTGGAPPAILADVKYADAVADWSGAIDALDVALR